MAGWIVAVVCFALLVAGCVAFVKILLALYARQEKFEEELEERVDSSLAVLDACYMEMAAVANKPVFFDSPEVRSVVRAIQRSRDAVLHVIHVLDDIDVEDKTDEVKPNDVEYLSEGGDVVNDMLESAAADAGDTIMRTNNETSRRASAASVAVKRRVDGRKAFETRG